MDTAELDRISYLTIQSAIEIHKTLGPGLLENVYRPFLVNDAVVVELKAVESVHPVHRAQILSYLRLMDKQLGLLINFHVERLVLGVDRIVNKFGWPESHACKSTELPIELPKS